MISSLVSIAWEPLLAFKGLPRGRGRGGTTCAFAPLALRFYTRAPPHPAHAWVCFDRCLPHTGAYSPTSAGRVGERGVGPGRSSTDQAVSTMCWVVRPYLVNRYWASLAPSAKVSWRPMRRRGRPRPASASASATAEPRPPMIVWFSAVTTAVDLVATARTVAVSRGLMTGTFTTTVTTPAARRTRAAARAGATIMPLTSRATSDDGAVPEVHPPSVIPAPPLLTPPPVLTPPPTVSARPAICAPPLVSAPPAICAPPEVTPPPSVPAPPVVCAPPSIASPRHSSTWARSSDSR